MTQVDQLFISPPDQFLMSLDTSPMRRRLRIDYGTGRKHIRTGSATPAAITAESAVATQRASNSARDCLKNLEQLKSTFSSQGPSVYLRRAKSSTARPEGSETRFSPVCLSHR
jgi:hypothetical protein